MSAEDAMSMVHISFGMRTPPSPELRSECAILAGMACATLPDSATLWESYAKDFNRRVRNLAEFDLIDITSHARDGSTRSVYGYRALAYDIPAGTTSQRAASPGTCPSSISCARSATTAGRATGR